MRRECRERFPDHRLQRNLLVSDPDMHHGTCVTHVPWCMSGSLTRDAWENVPGITGACATCNFTYLVRGPCSTFYWIAFLAPGQYDSRIAIEVTLVDIGESTKPIYNDSSTIRNIFKLTFHWVDDKFTHLITDQLMNLPNFFMIFQLIIFGINNV